MMSRKFAAGGAGGGGGRFAPRSELFGDYNGASAPHASGGEEDAVTRAMEEENDELVAALESKVSTLKSVSISMRDEVRDQNTLLMDMAERMGLAQTGLGSTLQQLEALVEQGGGNANICGVTVLAVVVFLIVYFLFLR